MCSNWERKGFISIPTVSRCIHGSRQAQDAVPTAVTDGKAKATTEGAMVETAQKQAISGLEYQGVETKRGMPGPQMRFDSFWLSLSRQRRKVTKN